MSGGVRVGEREGVSVCVCISGVRVECKWSVSGVWVVCEWSVSVCARVSVCESV